MKQFTQDSGGGDIPGSVQKTSRNDILLYGLVGMMSFSQRLGLMTLEVFSSPNDSMIYMASQVFPFVGQMLSKAPRRVQVVHGSGL